MLYKKIGRTLGEWLMETGTPTCLRSRAFAGSNPVSPTKLRVSSQVQVLHLAYGPD